MKLHMFTATTGATFGFIWSFYWPVSLQAGQAGLPEEPLEIAGIGCFPGQVPFLLPN